MFLNCSSLIKITFGDNFDTSKVTSMSGMFRGCSSFTSLDLNRFNTANVRNMSYMFKDCTSLQSLDLSSFNTQKVRDMRYMFDSCKSLVSINLESFNTENVQNTRYMFDSCSSLTSLNLSKFNTSSVTDMDNMFRACSSLVSLDLRSFDTSATTNMVNLFMDCTNLKSLDLSSFNTSEVTKMNNMFKDCTSLNNLDLSSFDTSKVENMSYMFSDTGLNNLDLTSFNTSSVTTMQGMFRNTRSLEHISFGDKLNTSKVTDMSYMFCNSGLNSLDLSRFNTEEVISTKCMFAQLNNIDILDLSSFNLRNITEDNMKYMFSKKIEVQPNGAVIEGAINNEKALLVISKDSKLNNYDYTADACLPVGPTLNANGGKFEDGNTTVELKVHTLESLDKDYINKIMQDKMQVVKNPIKDGHDLVSWEVNFATSEKNPILQELNAVCNAMWAGIPATLPDDIPVEDIKPEEHPLIKDIVNEGGFGTLISHSSLKINTLKGLEQVLSTIVDNGGNITRLEEPTITNKNEAIYKLEITNGDNKYYVDIKVDSSAKDLVDILNRIPKSNSSEVQSSNNENNTINQNNENNLNNSTSNIGNDENPKTGDSGMLELIGLGLTSGLGLFINNRKKKNK